MGYKGSQETRHTQRRQDDEEAQRDTDDEVTHKDLDMKSVNIIFSASAWHPDDKDAWVAAAERRLIAAGFGPVKFTDLHGPEDKNTVQVTVNNANMLSEGMNRETALSAFAATIIVMEAFQDQDGYRNCDWTEKFSEPQP